MATEVSRIDAPIIRTSTFACLRYESGVLTVRFAGPNLTERESSIIGREISEALDVTGHSLRALVLDFRDVRMMSSMGVGMCIDSRNSATDRRAATVLYGLTRELTELFRMMKLDRLYRIAQTQADLDRLLAA